MTIDAASLAKGGTATTKIETAATTVPPIIRVVIHIARINKATITLDPKKTPDSPAVDAKGESRRGSAGG